MDTRYIVNHIKNEEEQAVHHDDDDDEHNCTSPRYINSTYHQSESSYTALNQKCLKRHYDQMMSSSSSPFCGPSHQVTLNDGGGGCFLKPHHHHPHLHHYHLHHQPILFRHQHPYNAVPPPHPPLPFDPSGVVCPGDLPSHLHVQEPKFPPQTFEIPDIYDSNSVFGGRGPLDPQLGQFGGYSSSSAAQFLPSYPGNPFYGSPGLPDRHSPRGSTVPPHPPQPQTAFPGAWQQQQQQPARVLSSTGSTDSSPGGGSQAEESTTAAPETPSSLQQPQQVQPSVKSNGLTSSHSSISRLPNKKARSPKRRKRKDPNEPQKPVSAYSLFFRNAQAAIKSQNPSATFGDVSKIVASMWDGLDDDVKNFYKRQMEMAKKEYLKQLAIYRATLVSKDVQEKTGTDSTDAGLSAPQHQAPPPPPPPPPPPTTPPVRTPSSQKPDDGTGGSSLSPPVPTAPLLCVPSMGFQAQQQPLSPTAESVGHHHHHHNHHHHLLHHMMSPPSSTSHPQPSPLFYQDGSPCLQIGYTSSSDASSSSSSSSAVMMRSNFLTYGQKLDHESIMQRIPEPSPSYFIGMSLDAEYNKSGEFLSLGNSFVNGLCREILPCRSFVESDEADDDQKLT